MAEYIEKSTVLAIIGKHWRSKMYADDAIQAALDEIGYHVPSADVQPVRHGRWRIGSYSGNIGYAKEKWYDSFFTGAFYYCDCCRERAKRITPYCPNCGAKMDGGET